MQRLLCEPEDRLGSQSTVSTSRPNSLIMSVRRSGFFGQLGGGSGGASIDGAEHIKVRLHVHGTIGGKMWTKADWFALIHSALFITTTTAKTRPTTGVPTPYYRETRRGYLGRVCCD